jgi:hypothetical protein
VIEGTSTTSFRLTTTPICTGPVRPPHDRAPAAHQAHRGVERALGAGGVHDEIVVAAGEHRGTEALPGRELVVVAGRQLDLGAEGASCGHHGEADAPTADHRQPHARLDAAAVQRVHGDRERLDQPGVGDVDRGWQGHDAPLVDHDHIGEAAIEREPVGAVEDRAALLAGAGQAPVAGAARQLGLDGDGGAVVEHAGELVPERHGAGTPVEEVEVRSADAGRAHPHPHEPGAGDGLGLGHLDHGQARVGVAHCSHGSLLTSACPDAIARTDPPSARTAPAPVPARPAIRRAR